jgi:phosphatidylglycerol:prolipoprotein diacylglycerol transferase
MKFPLEFSVGGLNINGHLLFETLGFIIGYRYYSYLRKKQTDTINDSNRLSILIAATFGAFFFSRIIGALESPIGLIHSQNLIIDIFKSKTIIGALLGGLLFVEITKKMIGEKSSSGDLFTYPLILAICIGRIGCFTSGIYEPTYGNPTSFFTGMNLGDGILRHPTSLYEIVYLVLLFIGLQSIEKLKPLKEGNRFKLYMILYLSFRFFVEFIKPGYTFIGGIGTIQIACLLGLIYYSKTIVKSLISPKYLFS